MSANTITTMLRIVILTSLTIRGLHIQAAEPVSKVPSPADHLGRPVGTDFRLADWGEVSEYYTKLDAASDRVVVENIGQTTEGRDFLLAIISSKENLSQVETLRKYARQIAHPDRCTPAELQTALTNGKVIVFITLSMHSDETASTEMGMQLAYQLATSEEETWKKIRHETVVVIVPSLNPDGVDHVVRWYRQNQGTPFEGTDLPRLYQYYTGHDNNRDWFALTQIETRLLTEQLYKRWHPQVLWDVHQYSGQKERLFVPPYRDPLNPNLDPGIVVGINLLGTRATADLLREDIKGVAQGVGYDHWWNGGNRSVPCRHNMMGILTEAASVNIASPVFLPQDRLSDPLKRKGYQASNQFISPWEGGWWRLSDIIRYELAFGTSLLSSLSRERDYWLTNARDAAQRSIDLVPSASPVAWIIPADEPDRGSVERFVDVLLSSGVEVDRCETEMTADGRTYPAGSLLIRRAQAFGNYAKDLLEVQVFPNDVKPYDVTGWSLPYLFGVRCVEVAVEFEGKTLPVSDVAQATASFLGDARLRESSPGTLSLADHNAWKELIGSLKAGESRSIFTDDQRTGLVMSSQIPPSAVVDSKSLLTLSEVPRIGVYSPWSGSMDEGWLRWMLDSTQIPFLLLHNEAIKAGHLRDVVDVIIMPDLSDRTLKDGRSLGSAPERLTGGLENFGIEALEEFALDGGTLIACQNSANWLREELDLPIKDVTQGDPDFLCSGSIVRAETGSTLLTNGMPRITTLFFSSSKAWQIDLKATDNSHVGEITTHLSYAPRNVLVSGAIQHPETIEGAGAWVELNYGKGQIHLFGFRPHYRGWTQETFHLLYRPLLMSRPVKEMEAAAQSLVPSKSS